MLFDEMEDFLDSLIDEAEGDEKEKYIKSRDFMRDLYLLDHCESCNLPLSYCPFCSYNEEVFHQLTLED